MTGSGFTLGFYNHGEKENTHPNTDTENNRETFSETLPDCYSVAACHCKDVFKY